MAQVHPIPTLPAVHAQALGLLSDPSTSIPQLGQIVETDPAQTVSVLRAGNSATLAPVTPIGTLAEAIVRVGLNSTCKIITPAVVSESFNRLDYAGIDSNELWRHLFTTALVADASAWGAEQRSTQVAPIAKGGGSILDAEDAGFGVDSQSWGVDAGRAWNVPDEIIEAVDGFADGSVGPLAWVAWNGRRISASLGIGDGVQPAELMDVYGELTDEDEQLLSSLGGRDALIEQAEWMLGSVSPAKAA